MPTTLLAGGKAVLVAAPVAIGDNMDKLTLTWQDLQTFRMDIDEDDDGYLLTRDGKTYSIFQEDDETIVMDLASLPKGMQEMMFGQNKGFYK